MSNEPRDPIRLEERRNGARTVLAIEGELDLATVDDVRNRLDALRRERRAVVLDIDELAFMDSTGIRLILQATEDSRRDGWDFAITRGSFAVRRVFEAARIEDRLPYASGSGQ
jgi:anti-sigma B factor antagonist